MTKYTKETQLNVKIQLEFFFLFTDYTLNNKFSLRGRLIVDSLVMTLVKTNNGKEGVFHITC